MERLFKHKDFWNDFFLRTVHDNNLLFKIFYKFYRIYRPSGLVKTQIWIWPLNIGISMVEMAMIGVFQK